MSDLSAITAALAAIRNERPQTVALRRGAATLAPQVMRVELSGAQAREQENDTGREIRARAVITGAPTLDIAVDDRFNDANGHLYRVTLVNPNRSVMTVAEADLVE